MHIVQVLLTILLHLRDISLPCLDSVLATEILWTVIRAGYEPLGTALAWRIIPNLFRQSLLVFHLLPLPLEVIIFRSELIPLQETVMQALTIGLSQCFIQLSAVVVRLIGFLPRLLVFIDVVTDALNNR